MGCQRAEPFGACHHKASSPAERSGALVGAGHGPSPRARKRNPNLPTYWEVREVSYESRGHVRSLLTSLPAGEYSAEAVAQLYLERWEIELGFRDIKSSMQQNAVTLRSKKIDLIYQEVWGLLLAYNIIRREASQAAVAFGRTPSDIRFKPACQ